MVANETGLMEAMAIFIVACNYYRFVFAESCFLPQMIWPVKDGGG
jgi:hypothetical protein